MHCAPVVSCLETSFFSRMVNSVRLVQLAMVGVRVYDGRYMSRDPAMQRYSGLASCSAVPVATANARVYIIALLALFLRSLGRNYS